jgi:LCP family protein required for cell wall assembly
MTDPQPTTVERWRTRLSARRIAFVQRWPRFRSPALTVAALGAAVMSTAAVGGVNVILTIDEGRDQRDVPGLSVESDFANKPRNVLILGSDTRAGLSEEEQAAFGSPETVSGERSDTIILMHIDPRREKAVMVHFPRDLQVEIPGHGTDKINAAYTYGGPGLVVRTVKEFTGLPIHNYMEVDLAGFERLIDVVGGVRMCVDRPLFDELAGLSIPRAGCYMFDGRTALAFVRARHIEGDLIPDFSRITRQQQFMRAMMNKILSLGSLLDQEVIEEAARQVTTDTRLSTADLIYLGARLRQLAERDPSGATSLDFRVVPGAPQTQDGISYVIAQQPDADRLFEALAEGTSLGSIGTAPVNTAISPAVIRVRVLSAGLTSEAQEAGGLLRRAGFIVLEQGTAPEGTTESEILYAPGKRDRAQVVGGYFPDLPQEEGSASILGNAEVAVVVGEDFEGTIG